MVRKHGNFDPNLMAGAMASLEQELVNIGLDLEASAVEYINTRGINVDATLMKSVKSLVKKELSGIDLHFGSNAKHAVYVHSGTKPHFPPVQALKPWVRKKLNVPVKEVNGVAFLVARKISKKGTQARPFLAVAIRAHRSTFESRIKAAIDRGLA